MRRLAWLVLGVALSAEGQWTPPPTATPRPATPAPRPTATRPAVPTARPTGRPTTAPTAAPAPTSGPACPTPALREYVFLPVVPVLTPEPGQTLRFSDGTEFLVLVRHSSIGEVPYRLVRVR